MRTFLLMLAILALAGAAVARDAGELIFVGAIGLLLVRWLLDRPAVSVGIIAFASTVAGTTWVSPAKFSGIFLALPLSLRMMREPSPVKERPVFLQGMAALLVWLAVCDLLGTFSDRVEIVVSLFGTVVCIILLRRYLVTMADLALFALCPVFLLGLLGLTIPLFISASDMAAEVTRTGGLAGEPNGLGTVIGRLYPFIFAVMISRRFGNTLKIAAAVFGAAAVWALFAANSRSGTISFIVSTLAFALLASNRTSRRASMIGVAVGVLIAAYLLAPVSFVDRTISSLMITVGLSDRTVDIEELTSGRHTMNLIAWDVFLSQPILGHGGGGFLRATATSSYAGTQVHNAYLAFAVWGGAPAIFLALGLHVYAAITGVKATLRAGEDQPLAAACLAAGLGSISTLVNSPMAFSMADWVCLALCTYLPGIVAREQAAPTMAPEGGALAAADPEASVPLRRRAHLTVASR